MTPDEIVRGKPLLTRVRTSNDIKYAEDLTSRWCLQGNSNFRKADFEQFLLVEGLGFRYQRLHSPPKASRHLYLSGALQGCSGCDESSTHPWSEYLEASEFLRQRRFTKPPMVGFTFQHNDKRIYSFLEFANDLVEQGVCGSQAGLLYLEQFNVQEKRRIVDPCVISKAISEARNFTADERFDVLASSHSIIPNPHNLSLSSDSDHNLSFPGLVSPTNEPSLAMAPTLPPPPPLPVVATQPGPGQPPAPSPNPAQSLLLQEPLFNPLTSAKLLAAATATIQGRTGSQSAKVAAIIAVVETLQDQEAKLKAAIISETKVSYGSKQTWKPSLITLHEQHSEIMECLNVELQKSIVTLNSEVELCSARMKSVESNLANKTADMVDKKFRSSSNMILDKVSDTMAGQVAKITALDQENTALGAKLLALDEQVKLLVDNSLYHGSSLESISSSVMRIEQFLTSSSTPLVQPPGQTSSQPATAVLPDLRSRLSGKRQVESPWLSGGPPSKLSAPQVIQRTVMMNPSPSPSLATLPHVSIFPTPTSPSTVSGSTLDGRSLDTVTRQLNFTHPPPSSPGSGQPQPDHNLSLHSTAQGDRQGLYLPQPGTPRHLPPLFSAQTVHPAYPQQLNTSAFINSNPPSAPGLMQINSQDLHHHPAEFWVGQAQSQPIIQGQAPSQPLHQGHPPALPLLQGQGPSQSYFQGQATSQPRTQGQAPSQQYLQGHLPLPQSSYQGQASSHPRHQGRSSPHPHHQGLNTQSLQHGQNHNHPSLQGQAPPLANFQGQTPARHRHHVQTHPVKGYKKGRN